MYVSGGSILSSFNANPQYTLGLSQSDVGLLGVVHNAVEIDISFLGSNIDNFTAHFTYGCGNDNLMGQVPEPATILLSGIGLLGIGFVMRRRVIK